MSTGYFYADWRQGGSVPGKTSSAAGGLLTVFDWLFLQGPSPWTKTFLGTNIASYTAPGGSQVSLYVDNSVGVTTGNYARLRAVVAGQTFPTSLQETSLGNCLYKTASSNNTGTSYFYSWYGIRTDRMAIVFGGNSDFAGTSCTGMIVGDMPVFDPADPGLCILSGSAVNTAFPVSGNLAEMFLTSGMYSTLGRCGHAYQTKTGSIFSPGCALRSPVPQSGPALSAMGDVPLQPMLIYTASDQSDGLATAQQILRGWVPFLYPLPMSGMTVNSAATTQGDTFTAGSAEFEAFAINGIRHAWMLTDSEPLP